MLMTYRKFEIIAQREKIQSEKNESCYSSKFFANNPINFGIKNYIVELSYKNVSFTMCGPTTTTTTTGSTSGKAAVSSTDKFNKTDKMANCKETMTGVPVEVVHQPPSLASRYACASAMVAVFGVWGKICFDGDESQAPSIGQPLHGPLVPLVMTGVYLAGLPLLRQFAKNVLSEAVDVKLLLKETMIVYNGGQVLLNAWMVYRIMDALLFHGHPFVGDIYNVTSGATFAVYIHYMDKYLEFFDTIFMVLRGRMDQVSFLHVYHHVSIAWAWWYALYAWPGGDAYFGALLNSIIHVMMYSYYTLSLCKISCPWKRYLTQCQLLQFTTVVLYTCFCTYVHVQQQDLEPKHWGCLIVQFFEMTSMFVLFMHFYNQAYKKKKAAKAKKETDSVPEQESISSDSSDEQTNKKDL